MRLTRLSTLAAFAFAAAGVLGGCSGAGTPIDGTGTSGAPAASSGATPAAPADPIVGIYHLSQVDATNLELRADGTYTWSIEGCDFGGGQCGYWKRNVSGEIRLSAGTADIEWSWGGSFRQKMQWLRVTPTSDGVRVDGVTDDSRNVQQTWKSGRSCAICGGNLGPTGQEACSAPLPDVCVRQPQPTAG